jgi:SAM-dependent methyltransferase
MAAALHAGRLRDRKGARSRIMSNDLTDKEYWRQRLKTYLCDRQPPSQPQSWEWMPIILKFLSNYAHGSFLELGCSPGDVSAAICARVPLRPEGVDFADTSEGYLTQMRSAGMKDAILHRCDIRKFRPGRRFEIVASFGLVEHFTDFETVLNIHDDLLAPGGLCIVEVPHFRRLQYLYHYLFDQEDLRRHNTRIMKLEVFRSFAARRNHRILHLDYCGPLRFWGTGQSGPKALRFARTTASRVVQVAAKLLGRSLPVNHPYLAPWILYIGQKNPTATP